MENQNQNVRQQLIDRLKESNNVLVTVSRNPSVDQLSSAIGLTLMLNQLGKHATAVFSGNIPNTLEFLKPEETIEKTTDSLRDFIISLDKAKADKLRYKVEDKMVKIFITPYRTSLTEADLVYEQGDFNVDTVIGIGVREKDDLDEAITSHGRILHDATVATLNTTTSGQLGSINWVDAKASSLSEMLVNVCEGLKAGALDAQMATAFLTGIVAETQRFSNDKTSSDTMNVSAKLMNAGANQQLVATKLEQPVVNTIESVADSKPKNDGSLDIAHSSENNTNGNQTESDLPEIQPDHNVETPSDHSNDFDEPSRLIMQPPSMGGTLTANSKEEGLDPSTDPLTVSPVNTPLLSHSKPAKEEPTKLAPAEPEPTTQPAPTPPLEPILAENQVKLQEPKVPVVLEPPKPEVTAISDQPKPAEPFQMPLPPDPAPLKQIEDDQTLTDLESAVDSPHIADKLKESYQAEKPVPDASEALAAAHEAFDSAEAPTEKPVAFNASGPMEVAHEEPDTPPTVQDILAPESQEATEPVAPISINIDPTTGQMSYPENLVPTKGLPADPTATLVSDPTAPPPVPPPMAMPPLIHLPEIPSDELPLPPPNQ